MFNSLDASGLRFSLNSIPVKPRWVGWVTQKKGGSKGAPRSWQRNLPKKPQSSLPKLVGSRIPALPTRPAHNTVQLTGLPKLQESCDCTLSNSLMLFPLWWRDIQPYPLPSRHRTKLFTVRGFEPHLTSIAYPSYLRAFTAGASCSDCVSSACAYPVKGLQGQRLTHQFHR